MGSFCLGRVRVCHPGLHTSIHNLVKSPPRGGQDHGVRSVARTQSVVIYYDVTSESADLKYGVPQGSVLGPMPGTGIIARRFNLEIHLFAMTSSSTCFFKLKAETLQWADMCTLESCVAEIRIWMAASKICPNDSNTEFVIRAHWSLQILHRGQQPHLRWAQSLLCGRA